MIIEFNIRFFAKMSYFWRAYLQNRTFAQMGNRLKTADQTFHYYSPPNTPYFALNNPMETKAKTKWRIALLGGVLLSFFGIYHYTPVGDWFSLERLQKTIEHWGEWGFVLFFGVFLAGTLLNVPCGVFLVFSFWIYGYALGTLLSYITAVLTSMINFYFARWIGGGALTEVRNSRMQRIMQRVEERPVHTTVWLRLIFLMSPMVNYALALSGIRPRHFFWGNVIGFVAPIAVFLAATVLFQSQTFNDLWMAWFG